MLSNSMDLLLRFLNSSPTQTTHQTNDLKDFLIKNQQDTIIQSTLQRSRTHLAINIMSQQQESSIISPTLSTSPESIYLSKQMDSIESGIFDNSFNDDSSFSKKNKSNRFFPPNAVDVLKKWFEMNQDYPYPDENTTNLLAKEANISSKQVRKWFANKRVRSNKCVKQNSRSKKMQLSEDNNDNSSEIDAKNDVSINNTSTPVATSANNIPKSESTPNNLASMVNIAYWQQQQQQQQLVANSAFYNPMILMYLNNQNQALALQAALAQQQYQQQLKTEFEMTNSILAKQGKRNCLTHNKETTPISIIKHDDYSIDIANSLNDSFPSSYCSSIRTDLSSRRSSNASIATDVSSLSSLESFAAAARRRVNFGDVSDLIN